MPPVIVDANLLLLLIVGLAGIEIIPAHRNLSGYSVEDYLGLSEFVTAFSNVVLLPHVLTEVSNLSRQIKDPYRTRVQEKLRDFIEANAELPLPSVQAVRREEFLGLGLTDAAILHALGILGAATGCALLTVDGDLATAGEMLGHDVYTIQALRGQPAAAFPLPPGSVRR